jgi:hypothetical protein
VSKVRARVEHVFGAQQTSPGGRIVRTIGIVRAKAKIGLQNLAYNIPSTSFKTGQPRPPTSGRRSGKLGQRTELINEAMVRAAEELGFVREVKTVGENGKETTELQCDGDGGVVGFLKWAALYHTAAFLSQFGRLIPAQMNVRTEKTVDIAYRSFEEVLVDLKATGLTDEKIELLLEDLRPSLDTVSNR